MRSLALWDGEKATLQLGSGIYGKISSMTFVGSNVYAVGRFRLTELSPVDQTFGCFSMVTMSWTFPPLPQAGLLLSDDPFRCIHAIGPILYIGGGFSFPAANTSTIMAYNTTSMLWQDIAPSSESQWRAEGVIFAIENNETHLFVGGSFQLTTASLGSFFNLACLDLAKNQWVNIAYTCDSADVCAPETIRALSWSGSNLFVGGNFSYIGIGQIRTQVNNVAVLEAGKWKALGLGLATQPVVTLVAVSSLLTNRTVIAGGYFFLKIFADGNWKQLDESWDWRVYQIRTLLLYYTTGVYVPPPWPAFGVALAIIMSILIVVGFIIVIFMMRRRVQSSKLDYSVLDMSSSGHQYFDDSVWLIDYHALKIQNPPIGKGAYSVVNRALLKGTVVAVKTFVGADYFGDIRADFTHEIALLMRLRHPNIILFIGACNEPLCIVTELAERGCLLDVIHQSPEEMTFMRIKSLSLDAARGLAYLHNQAPPILHRDLKSVNILVSESFVAKVSDFGIAKRLAVHTMTHRVGTLRWTAPEVLANNTYSLGSDVYSFGVILWEMMSLTLPWPSLSFDHQIEDRVTSGERLPLSPFWPSKFQDVMVRAWQLNPLARPSFTDLIGLLERLPNLEDSPQREVIELEASLADISVNGSINQ